MLRLSLTRKLLLALLLANIILVSIIAVSETWSFHRGFMKYLRQVELRQLDALDQALVAAYTEQGSWDFLRHDLRRWRQYLSYLPGVQDMPVGLEERKRPEGRPGLGGWSPPPPPLPMDNLRGGLDGDRGDEFARPRHFPPGHPPGSMRPQEGDTAEDVSPPSPSEREHKRELAGRAPRPEPSRQRPAQPEGQPLDDASLIARLSLLDQEGKVIIGVGGEGDGAQLRPLLVNGKQVGSLRLAPQDWLNQGLEYDFRLQQRQTILYASLAALFLSLLVSIPLGRHLLRPVKGLLDGVRSLAAGQYDTRIHRTSSDELGSLVDDFNLLAGTLGKNEELRRHAMADVSHELRTPLSVLRGEIEAVQDGIRPCNEERLAVLHRGVLDLSRLVDDLYELAMSDQGALTYCREPLDISKLLVRTVKEFKGELQRHGLQVEGKIRQGLIVRGDEGRLHQVFVNLLKNSLRYTEEGGQVRITCKEERHWVKVIVEDSPAAVPPEDLPHLFDRFFRVDRARTRRRGGAGLGLALCKNIIEAHGGSIKARASELGGLGLHICLPRYNA